MTEKEIAGRESACAVGILFVHGIGEQKKGDTLLGFADPFVRWINRSLNAIALGQKNESLFDLECKVVVDESSPQELTLRKNGFKDSLLVRESWWAYNFRAPKIRELSWWLLLVGTYVTLSHAAKPVIESSRKLAKNFSASEFYILLVAFFRLIFFYTPMAMTFQLIVIVLTVLAAIPLLPFSEGLTKLLLTLSSTLGDSYLLNHSPIQRRMAIDNVRKDIILMLAGCKRLNVVAHSQGAAISYLALREMMADGLIDEKTVQFISVGSGLDKLSALDELNSTLEFSKTNHPVSYVRFLYLLPAVFAVFWAVAAAVIAGIVTFITGVLLVSGLIVGLWIVALKFHKYMPSEYSLGGIRWVDIFASSDPVSNGAITGPTISHEIINSRALITDHTEYFSNNTDFFPRLAKESLAVTGLDWMVSIDQWSDARESVFGWVSRSIRKHCLMIGNWINRVFLVIFLLTNSGSLVASGGNDLLSLITDELKRLLSSNVSDYFQIIWFKGLVIFFVVHFFLKWANFSGDRSADNLFFSADILLKITLRMLTLSLVLVPLFMWLLFIVPSI